MEHSFSIERAPNPVAVTKSIDCSRFGSMVPCDASEILYFCFGNVLRSASLKWYFLFLLLKILFSLELERVLSAPASETSSLLDI
jgi:hypothetical protein